jgi:hypothetical protein
MDRFQAWEAAADAFERPIAKTGGYFMALLFGVSSSYIANVVPLVRTVVPP